MLPGKLPLLQLDLVCPQQSDDFIHAYDVGGNILHPVVSDDPANTDCIAVTAARMSVSFQSDAATDVNGTPSLHEPAPELDFTGVETLDFVADRDGEETAEVSTIHRR